MNNWLYRRPVFFSAFIGLVWHAHCAEPLYTVVDTLPGAALLQNGDFEESTAGRAKHWSSAPDGMTILNSAGRHGSSALLARNTDTTTWTGASQTIRLDHMEVAPIVVRGWSKAKDVSGSADSGTPCMST